MLFLIFSMQDMNILILISRSFCVLCVFMLWEMNAMTNKWCRSSMKVWFHKLGTHIRTFWLQGFIALWRVMYNLFMNYTHSNICTRKKHECKLKFQI
jgi:hypothetical protein